MMRYIILVAGLCMTGVTVAASDAPVKNYYFGGGFGFNKVPGITDPKTELQLFGGYLPEDNYGLDPSIFTVGIEAGYMDTSDVDRDGWWVTPMVSAHVAPLTSLLVRAGAETGHDNGVVYGAGVSYQIERNMAVRLEYVEHPKAHSVQFNVIYRPWSY